MHIIIYVQGVTGYRFCLVINYYVVISIALEIVNVNIKKNRSLS